MLMRVDRYRLQAKRVFACGNHGQCNRVSIPAGVHVFGFEPRTQTRIVDLRLTLPEIWRQPTLDPEMIQLQLDRGDILGEISPYIVCTDEQSGEPPTLTWRFDDHMQPARQRGGGIRF